MAEDISQLFRNSIYWKGAGFDIASPARNLAHRAAARCPMVISTRFPKTPRQWEAVGILVTAYFACDDRNRGTDALVQTLLEALHMYAGLPRLTLTDGLEAVTAALARAYADCALVELNENWTLDQATDAIGEGRGIDRITYLYETSMKPSSLEQFEQSTASAGNEHTAGRLDMGKMVQEQNGVFKLDFEQKPVRSPNPKGQTEMAKEAREAGLGFQCPYPQCMMSLVNLPPHLRDTHKRMDDFTIEMVDTERQFYVMSSLRGQDIVWRLAPR